MEIIGEINGNQWKSLKILVVVATHQQKTRKFVVTL